MLKEQLAILMVALVLCVFGCETEQSSIEGESIAGVSIEEIRESIREFQNRPIHRVLTIEIIDSTGDDELTQVVFDNLISKVENHNGDEYEIITDFSGERQAVYGIWLVEAEVNNGGFNQFYANSSGQFAEVAADGFELVGTEKLAALMHRANELYESNYEAITEKQDGTLEGFCASYDDNPLNTLDSVFYDLCEEEDLRQSLIDFIRKNKVKFVDN